MTSQGSQLMAPLEYVKQIISILMSAIEIESELTPSIIDLFLDALFRIQNVSPLDKMGTEGMYCNIIKPMRDKCTVNIIFNSEMLRTFPLRSGTRQ